MKKLATRKFVKRVVSFAAAVLMAFELIPLSSLTAFAASSDVASGVTDEVKDAGIFKMDVTIKSDDDKFDGAKADVTMTDSGDEYNKAIQALRDAGVTVDYRTTHMFSFSAKNGEEELDLSKAKADIDAEWGLVPGGYMYLNQDTRYDIYVYDGKSVKEQTEGVSKEDFMDMGYYSGYDKFTVNADAKVLFVNKLKEHEALEPGVYAISANLTVLGKNNSVLNGVQVYLTNLELPPTEPLENNATLTVSSSGELTVQINNLNGIFTLMNIEDGKDVHILGKSMTDTTLNEPEPQTRINALTIGLDNYNGFYSFANCKEYPTILGTYKEMPVDLIVDFDSAQLIYKPESGKQEYTKTFTDDETGITATVRTTDDTIGKKLDGAAFSGKELTEGAEYDEALYKMYRYKYSTKTAYYGFKLVDADGNKIEPADNQNNVLFTVDNISFDGAVLPMAVVLDDNMTELKTGSSNGKLSVNLNKLENCVFYESNGARTVYHSDAIADDGSGFAVTRYVSHEKGAGDNGKARSEVSGNDVKYYVRSVNAGNDWISADTTIGFRLEMSLPAENLKKHLYLVVSDGTNTYLREYGRDEMWNRDGKVYLNLIDSTNKKSGTYTDKYGDKTLYIDNKEEYGSEIYRSSFYSGIRNALDNGYDNKQADEKNWTAYILSTDGAYAGMPVLSGTSSYDLKLTYNGQSQLEKKWMLGDNTSVSGQTEAVNAGTYSFTAKPEDGYTWLDGTSDAKTYEWTIDKKQLMVIIRLEKNVISADDKIPDAAIEVSRFENGETAQTASGYVAPTVTGKPESVEKGATYKYTMTGGSADNYIFYDYSSTSSTLTILKDNQICVKKPVLNYPVYDKQPHKASSIMTEDETSKQFYTVTNGDYEMTYPYDSSYKNELIIELKDKENYIWDDGTTKDIKTQWSIKRAPLTVSYVSETITEGETPALQLKFDGFIGDDTYDEIKSSLYYFGAEAPEKLEAGKTYEIRPYCSDFYNNFANLYEAVEFKSGTLTVLKKQEEKPDEDAKTVTANLIVPGELNTQLPGVTAYMTNPDNPLGIVPDGYESVNQVAPTTPVSNNAKLKDNGDGTYNITFNVPNPVFTLQKIGNCSNAEVVSVVRDNKVYSGNTGVSRNGRITKLTIKLKDNSGTYVFNDCTEFPTLLETDWNVPLTLNVDFSGAKTDDTVTVVSDVNKTTEDAPNVSVSGITSGAKEYFKSLLTKEELDSVTASDGKLRLQVNVGNIDSTVSDEDKQLVKEAVENSGTLKNAVVGQYLDISAVVAGFDKKITELPDGESITLTVKLDDSMINKDADRTYYVVRIHENADGTKTADIIDTTFDNVTKTIKFSTDKFSTYAVVYTDNTADGSLTDDNTADTQENVPDTGDMSPVALYVLTMISAGLAAILTLSKKRKENE